MVLQTSWWMMLKFDEMIHELLLTINHDIFIIYLFFLIQNDFEIIILADDDDFNNI
jgi:hypothetical protein